MDDEDPTDGDQLFQIGEDLENKRTVGSVDYIVVGAVDYSSRGSRL